jgi:hypothetical protein
VRLKVPFLGTSGPKEVFCVRCRAMRHFADEPETRRLSTGQLQLTGECERCGAPLHQFISSGLPRKPRETRPYIRVSIETKQRVAEAAEFAGVPQGDLIELLARTELDRMVMEVGQELLQAGGSLTRQQFLVMREARARLRPSAEEMVRKRSKVEQSFVAALFGEGRTKSDST